MDKSERLRLKQLAIDAIVAYPYDHPIVPFAEALEKCVDWEDEVASKCLYCRECEDHGDSGEGLRIEASEVLEVHGQIKRHLKELQDALTGGKLTNPVATQIDNLISDTDELEALVIP